MTRWFVVAVALVSAPAFAASEAPFLWQVSSGQTTHYLLGSIHLLPADALPFPAAFEHAYASTRRIVFETDPAVLDSVEAQQAVAQAALRSTERSAPRPAQVAADLARQLQRLQLPDGACERLRDWSCALTLELTAFLRADFAPQYGIDAQFHTRARADGRDIGWLEDPQAHLRLLTDIGDAMGSELLSATLDELDDPRESPQQLLEAWRNGDTRAMASMVTDLRREHPDAYARLIGDRNQAWLAPLARQLHDDVPVLVIVGAAHWVGPDGLVARLRDAGFEVRAVEPAQ